MCTFIPYVIYLAFVCVCVYIYICVSWFSKMTRCCSWIDSSEQLKEDFFWICGLSDIINCAVRPRHSFPQSSSRVHPALAVWLK